LAVSTDQGRKCPDYRILRPHESPVDFRLQF
jgi:hypothetical protein